jgi:hypothetical protein
VKPATKTGVCGAVTDAHTPEYGDGMGEAFGGLCLYPQIRQVGWACEFLCRNGIFLKILKIITMNIMLGFSNAKELLAWKRDTEILLMQNRIS